MLQQAAKITGINGFVPMSQQRYLIEIGEMELGIFKLFIKNMNTYENNLIHLDNPYYKNKLV